MPSLGTVVRSARVDRTAVVGSLAAVTVAAWAVMIALSHSMRMPSAVATMPMAMPTVGHQLLLVSAMWSAMMVAMMVPSATPMVATFTTWTRSGRPVGRLPTVPAFLAGYLVVWLGFSLVAAGLQVALQRTELLTTAGAIDRPVVGGTVLVLAGLFQVTRWKESCLRGCRTPTGFLIAEWREGARGALVMGIRHGAYCLGCCWALMAVLFVVGTMHLGWMAAITVFVLAEKLLPRSLRISHVAAVLLVGWGLWIGYLA